MKNVGETVARGMDRLLRGTRAVPDFGQRFEQERVEPEFNTSERPPANPFGPSATELGALLAHQQASEAERDRLRLLGPTATEASAALAFAEREHGASLPALSEASAQRDRAKAIVADAQAALDARVASLDAVEVEHERSLADERAAVAAGRDVVPVDVGAHEQRVAVIRRHAGILQEQLEDRRADLRRAEAQHARASSNERDAAWRRELARYDVVASHVIAEAIEKLKPARAALADAIPGDVQLLDVSLREQRKRAEQLIRRLAQADLVPAAAVVAVGR